MRKAASQHATAITNSPSDTTIQNSLSGERPIFVERRKTDRPGKWKSRHGLCGNGGRHNPFFHVDDKLHCYGNNGWIARAVARYHDDGQAEPDAEHRRGGEHMHKFERKNEIEHRRLV